MRKQRRPLPGTLQGRTQKLGQNKDVQKSWLKNVPGNLQTAEGNWPELKILTPAQAKAKNG